MTPYQYCEKKAADSGSSFYYSFLFLPQVKRRAIIALYAFCREVDDVVDEDGDREAARSKLLWWRDELERTYQGGAQHPVTQALRPVMRHYDLPIEQFLEIIDGMEMDLDHDGYDSFKDLSLYCYRVAGVVGSMAAEIFGYKDRNTLKYAHELGIAFQLTNILRDVREDAERGRIYIPRDEMARFDVTAQQLRDGEDGPQMSALLKFQADRAREYYRLAMHRMPEVDRYAQRAGLIMATVYLTLLDRIEEQGFPVLERRVRLSRWHKLWLAWRTARLEAKRRRRYKKNHPRG